MPPRVAILDNSIFPDIYKPVEHWSRLLRVEWEAFPARNHRFPVPARFSHVIVTGSEASIMEPDSWVREEAEVVREAVHAGLAVLGSCWGHQLLAYVLSGPEHVVRCRRPEIGWIALRLDRDSDLLGPKDGDAWTFSLHFDEVRDVADSFEILASTDLCPVQAMRLRGGRVWGLQCHPEVDVLAARKFLRDLIDSGFKGRDLLLEALASRPRDSGLVRRVVSAFLRPDSPGERLISLDK
jgi:GMP synthase-like glutamine amidotransferase